MWRLVPTDVGRRIIRGDNTLALVRAGLDVKSLPRRWGLLDHAGEVWLDPGKLSGPLSAALQDIGYHAVVGRDADYVRASLLPAAEVPDPSASLTASYVRTPVAPILIG